MAATKQLSRQQEKKLAKRAQKLALQTPVREERVSQGLSILEMPNREYTPQYHRGHNELVHVTLHDWIENHVPYLVTYDRGRHELHRVRAWLNDATAGEWMKAYDYVPDKDNSLIVGLRFSIESDAVRFKVAFE